MPISKTSNSVKGYLGRNLPPTSITRLTSPKQSLTLGFCKVSCRIQWKLSSTCVSAEWEVMEKLKFFKWNYKGAVKPLYPSPIFSNYPLAIAISYTGSTITLLSLVFQTWILILRSNGSTSDTAFHFGYSRSTSPFPLTV